MYYPVGIITVLYLNMFVTLILTYIHLT